MRNLYLTALVLLTACGGNNTPDHDPDVDVPHQNIPPAAVLNYNIIRELRHDTSSYTQGLEIHDGKLYESTGDYENSALMICNRQTAGIERKHNMGSTEIFGEGITIFKNKIYQLTWQNHIVNVYDLNNIDNPVSTFNWPYEGWGITHDTVNLYVSDGSSNIYTVDPSTFKVVNTISVRDESGPITALNELEYVNGSIYANVYQSKIIVKFDAKTGIVNGKLFFPDLLKQQDIIPDRTDVLNGIAYDAATNTFLITGKRWPKLFELKLN